MAFTIPHEGEAAFPAQAAPDKVDFDIINAGIAQSGVVSGCAVSAQGTPDMTVAVASGVVQSLGTRLAVTSGNLTIGIADPAEARFDLIVVTSAGAKAVRPGVAIPTAVFPVPLAGDVVLAAVYVPASDTDIDPNQIVDKRVSLPPNVTTSGYVIAYQGATQEVLLGDVGGLATIRLGSDTNIYRVSANNLKTDDSFLAASYISAFQGTAQEISLGDVGGAPTIRFASGVGAFDTNIYRVAANNLKTDDRLDVVLAFTALGGTFEISGSTAPSNNDTVIKELRYAVAGASRDGVVSVGGTDSGGAGFRCLRVPN